MDPLHVRPSKLLLLARVRRAAARFRYRLYDTALNFVLDRHPTVRSSKLVRYAESELRLAGYFNKAGFYGDMLGHAILRQVKLFAAEGHSGMSASVAANTAKHVIMFRPLTPLTGEDSEWIEVGAGVFQNRRCSSIFKENGQAYRSDGKVFREPSGVSYTGRDSRVAVAFPWAYSDPEIVDVEAGR